MRKLPLLVTLGLLSACARPAPTLPEMPASPLPPPNVAGPGQVAQAASGVILQGTVRIPAGMVAAGSLNDADAGVGVVGSNAAGMVAAGGGNYALRSLEQAPARGARIFLADAAGNAIPGLDATTTDEKGAFTLKSVPADFTYVVACEWTSKAGKKSTFQTLAKPGKLGATVECDAATTLVAAHVLEGMKGGDLGELNPAVFKTAAETTAKNLTNDKLPDFSDRAAVRTLMAKLVTEVQELKASVDQLHQDLLDIKKTLADMRSEIAAGRTATPVASATPAGGSPPPDGVSPPPDGVSPSPGGTAAPRATPVSLAACNQKSHRFVLPAADATRVAMIEFRLIDKTRPASEWIVSGTAKAGADFWTAVSEGCPLNVAFLGPRGEEIARLNDFVIPAGSADDVRLELPRDPAPTPTPGSATGTTASPTACGPGDHHFVIPETDRAVVAWIDLKQIDPSTPEDRWLARGTAKAAFDFYTGALEGCPIRPVFYDSNGNRLGAAPDMTIAPGSPLDVRLEVPGGVRPLPTGACTAPIEHTFKVVGPTGAAYMLWSDPGKTPDTAAAQPQLQADGSFKGAAREGCAQAIKIFDRNWQTLGYLPAYVLPVGAPRDVSLRF